MTTPERLAEISADWSPLRRERAAGRLALMRARAEIVGRASHPAELAKLCDPDYVITPAVELASRNVEAALRGRRRRLMITAPPQEFKSYLCAVWTPLRALQINPNWRVMLLTFADGLAEEHSIMARSFVERYGSGVVDPLTGTRMPDRLGLSVSPDKASAGNWRINEGDGGLVAAGRDATITGRRADLLIIDDPYKNMQEADSVAVRTKVDAWYRSVAVTRLAPGASVILIQTRWHPNDLAGTLLNEDRELPPEEREWRYLNIPAQAHAALPDALGREPGTYLESARGRTPSDFKKLERDVGKRVWNALFQGSPVPPEGGLFSGAWFDDHRLDAQPDRSRVRIVCVDPSESGEGDEAGIIGAALLYPPNAEALTAYKLMGDPEALPPVIPAVALTHDRSAQMTSDQWANAAVDLALEIDAAEIVIEAYTAGDTYLAVVRRVIADRLKGERDQARRLALTNLSQRIRKWRGTGDAVARSALLRQAVEVGTCVVVAHELAEMEMQARLWQVGQHQPDRVAAAVIAHDRLVQMQGRVATIASPINRRGPDGNGGWLARKVG